MDAQEAYYEGLKMFDYFYNLYHSQVQTVAIVGLAVVLALWARDGFPMPHLKKPHIRIPIYGRWRAMRISRTAREERNMSFIADGITDLLVDAIAKGRLTQKEADYYAKLFAHKGKINDLRPGSQIALINQLKRERDRREILKKRGEYILPRIPGDLPPQDCKNELMLTKLERTFRKTLKAA